MGCPRWATVALGCWALFGCSLDWTDEDDVDAGPGAGGGGAAPVAGCVQGQDPPAELSACTPEGTRCEYGDHPKPGCRTVVQCETGRWQTETSTASGQGPSCPDHSPTRCPDPGAAVNTMCPGSEVLCYYDNPSEPQCGCAQNSVGTFACAPMLPAGCPYPAAPDFGQACATEGLTCSYGLEDLGTLITRSCVAGVWSE